MVVSILIRVKILELRIASAMFCNKWQLSIAVTKVSDSIFIPSVYLRSERQSELFTLSFRIVYY